MSLIEQLHVDAQGPLDPESAFDFLHRLDPKVTREQVQQLCSSELFQITVTVEPSDFILLTGEDATEEDHD